MYLVCRHHHGAGIVAEFVLDACGLQRLHHLAGIVGFEIAVQQAPVRALPPQHDGDAGSDCPGNADQQQERPQVKRRSARRNAG